MTDIDGFFGALLGVPSLPGAKCRGRPHLFDEQHPGESDETTAERHTQALGLCGRCPSLAPCETYFLSLRPRERPGGVIAGRIHKWSNTTPAKKDTPR